MAMDSGSSDNFAEGRSNFTNIDPTRQISISGAFNRNRSAGVGTFHTSTNIGGIDQPIHIDGTHYVPSISTNLFSVSQQDLKGRSVCFGGGEGWVIEVTFEDLWKAQR